MRKRTTTRRAAVLRASALLLLACAGVGCSGDRRELTLQLEYRLGPTEKPAEALLAAHAVVERRVALIAPDARVLSVEPDRILVQVPELDAATMGVLRETMSLLGSLEFRLVAPGNSKAHKTWQDEKKAPEGYTEYTVTGSEKVLVCDHCEMGARGVHDLDLHRLRDFAGPRGRHDGGECDDSGSACKFARPTPCCTLPFLHSWFPYHFSAAGLPRAFRTCATTCLASSTEPVFMKCTFFSI